MLFTYILFHFLLRPNVIVLGNLPNTELYEDVNLFTDVIYI